MHAHKLAYYEPYRDAFTGLELLNFGDDDELIIDNFAGGGGASEGIYQALGVHPHYAVNHSRDALAMHAANHPRTIHLIEDVWKVDPVRLVNGRRVALCWFSPDCTHHSKAKGGRPVSNRIRGLAWVAVKWARRVKPRVIMLENVQEFVDWGPLKQKEVNGKPVFDEGGSPVMIPYKKKKGLTFKKFVGYLKGAGYKVEWRLLTAADYGAPTTRERLFLIARRDGQPITWPEPTHCNPRKKTISIFASEREPWRCAAECIDWTIPVQSIFGRKKPLVENTMRRIAKGLKKFVFENPRPFIIATDYKGKGRGLEFDLEDPLRTILAQNRFGIVTPYLSKYHGQKTENDHRCHDADNPIPTLDTSNRFAIVAPVIERQFGNSEGNSVEDPHGTIMADGGGKSAIVAPLFIPRFGEAEGQEPRCRDVQDPIATITPTNNNGTLIAAFLAKHYTGVTGQVVDQALGTVTTIDHHSFVAAYLSKFYGTNIGSDLNDPMPTVTATGQHIAEVRAFLVKYYGCGDGQDILDPMHTVTTKDRLGLVTISGIDYQIVDIGMRMLTPRELARAQGFREDYILNPLVRRKARGKKNVFIMKPMPQDAQVRMIGNSVCPPIPKALVAANLPDLVRHERRAVAV